MKSTLPQPEFTADLSTLFEQVREWRELLLSRLQKGLSGERLREYLYSPAVTELEEAVRDGITTLQLSADLIRTVKRQIPPVATPPTEEEFLRVAESMRSGGRTLTLSESLKYLLDPEEFAESVQTKHPEFAAAYKQLAVEGRVSKLGSEDSRVVYQGWLEAGEPEIVREFVIQWVSGSSD